VRFLNGEETLCEATVVDGTARCAVPVLPPPGDYVVVASYAGDEDHRESQRSFVLAVADGAPGAGQGQKADPHLRAKAKKSSLAPGRKVVLKAKVAAGVTGQVVFKSRGRTLCVATVDDGVATCKVRLKRGTWRVKATYAGSAAYQKDKVVFTVRKR